MTLGQSPRVRGNHDRRGGRGRIVGSIPAGAGKPPRQRGHDHDSRVNPRGCGETMGGVPRRLVEGGQSPRVRGNLVQSGFRDVDVGSIPAGAGKPVRRRRRSAHSRVNPRGCGETIAHSTTSNSCPGQSPRVRGNLDRCVDVRHAARSIPAGAGKPPWPSRPGVRCRVNPRGCGETDAWLASVSALMGQSPRVRGNPWRSGADRSGGGSIPAGAGKPR